MIPNIQTGKSFRGAQLYYLHDKREANEQLRLSDERVMWTETRNTAHDAAEHAFAEMIATARDQDQLKIMSGERLSGRQCEEPVMTISLSWHPSEKPGKEQMIEAADSYLRHMGWQEHQAVYAPHSDTAHPHLHIILNRIHPETGRVLDDSFSRNRTQEWARDYEREHGRIWCEERVAKDYSRADGEGSLPHDFAIDARDAQQRYAELEEAARTLDRREREQLARRHQDEREAFFDSRHQQFREAREAAYREVRDEYKDRWVEHFHKAEELREQAERDAADLAQRVLQFARQGDFAVAWEVLDERNQTTKAAEQEIAQGRRDLRAEQRIETRERQDEACAELYDKRALAYARIKQRQKEERDELKELQAGRAEREPYDVDRLIELVTEPVPERLVEHLDERDPDLALDGAELDPEAKPPPELVEERLAEREADTDTGRGAAHSDAVADTGEALAGGIGKIAEVLAEAIANLINPPTPRELAIEKARDRARDQAEAERQPAREDEEAKRRYAHHEQQRSATDTFESFFNENAERLRREEEERRQKTQDRDRER